MLYQDLKTISYADAWQYQHRLFDESIENKSKDLAVVNTLLFCEHPHTITIGKNGKDSNLLFNERYLSERGVELFHIDRGGDITYHGPGQLVGYPIFDLESYGIGIRQYIYNLEEIIIRLLASYGIQSERFHGAAGVWIDTDQPARTRKICAIGVRCSRFVTMHGFALNVNTDLSYFSLINPCGFVDKGMTSMSKELGFEIDMDDVKDRTEKIFREIFQEI